MNPERSRLLRTLGEQIEAIEADWQRPAGARAISLGPALDELLPECQLPAGSVVELLSEGEGAGTWTLALIMARHACGPARTMVIVDASRSFYPPAAVPLGIDLARVVVIRPRTRAEALLAANQSLRCPGVGALVGWYEPLRTLDVRRLQLAAEAGGNVGFLLRPVAALQAPSFATLRLRVKPLPSTETLRRLRVEVVRCRGGQDGRCLFLEIDHEANPVHLLPELAAAAPPARTTGASG
jgi:protein ImuA